MRTSPGAGGHNKSARLNVKNQVLEYCSFGSAVMEKTENGFAQCIAKVQESPVKGRSYFVIVINDKSLLGIRQ